MFTCEIKTRALHLSHLQISQPVKFRRAIIHSKIIQFSLHQQTVKTEVQKKLREEGLQSKAKKTGLNLPPLSSYDEKSGKLAKYMDYCCKFSWRMVTQVPPLKLNYQSQQFDERSHVPGFESDKKQTSSSQIKCFLWPTLLGCEKRVIAKGEVLL